MLKSPLSFRRGQLLATHESAEGGRAFQVDHVRCGENSAHHDRTNPLGEGIRAHQEFDHRGSVENDHARASRIAVITSTTSSAVTSDRAAI
jgi:hypothetical protein